MPSPVLTLLKEITLNLDTPNDLVYVSAKQYDVLARKVKINLVHNAAPWVIPSGLGGVIRYIKPDQTRGMYDTDDDGNPAIVITAGSSAASPGNVTITLAKQVLTTKGTIKIEVSLYSAAAEKLTTFSFPLVVEEAALSDIPFYESEDYFNFRSDMATIQQLNDAFKTATNTATSQLGLTIDNTLSIAGAIADAKAAGDMIQVSETEPSETSNILWIKEPEEEIAVLTTDDLGNLIAENYSTSKTYSAGDYVSYQGSIYKYIDGIPSSGAWDNSKWQAILVCDELGRCQRLLTDLNFEEILINADIIEAQGITLTLNSNNTLWASNGTIASVNYYRAINEPIPVKSGRTYRFIGLGGDQYTHGQAMFFSDAMNDGVNVSIGNNDKSITVPDGKTKVCLTMNSSYASQLGNVKIIGDIETGKYSCKNLVLDENQSEAIISNIPDDSINSNMTDFTELVIDDSWIDTENMLEGNNWSSPGYMRSTNGQLVTSTYTSGYVASDFIPVVPGFKYRFTAAPMKHHMLYVVSFSDSKNDGTSVNLGYISSNEYLEYTIPAGKTFISLNCEGNSGQNKTEGMFRRTQFDNEKQIEIPRLLYNGAKKLIGKKIINFGDSIFGQARPPVDISTILADLTGATVYNAGFGGCQMAYHANANYNNFSMYKIADAIYNENWSAQEASAALSGMPSYFAETVSMLKNMDFSEIDAITISYGTNDFENGSALGTNNNYSVDWALDYSINKILSKYPNVRIFVCVPMYRVWLSGGSFDYDSNTATHTSWVDSQTRPFKDFIEAEKTVANNNQIPVLDTYFDLGINKYNWLQYFPSNDGTHHKYTGRELIARFMADKLW